MPKTKLAIAAAAAAFVHDAAADTVGYYFGEDDFSIRLDYMPDFDQIRQTNFSLGIGGLPNDGEMYCVPAAAANLFAYIARHGYDDAAGFISPGVRPWEDNPNLPVYNAINLYIGGLGVQMNTDPVGGTNNNGNVIVQTHLDVLPASLFDVTAYWRTSTWAPKAREMAAVLQNGGIASICYGRFTVEGNRLIERTGGHCITLTGVYTGAPLLPLPAGEYGVRAADPVSNDSRLFQSPFVDRILYTEDIVYRDDDGNNPTTFSRIVADTASPRLFDSIITIFPKAGWGVYPDPSSFTYYRTELVLATAPGAFDNTPQATTIRAPGGRAIVAATLAPDRSHGVMLVEGDEATDARPGVYAINLQDAATTLVRESGKLLSMAYARDRTLWLLECDDRGEPTVIQVDPDPFNPLNEFAPLTRRPLPSDLVPLAIAYDDAAETPLVLLETKTDTDEPGDPVIMRLVGELGDFRLVPELVAGDFRGVRDLAVSSAGDIYLASETTIFQTRQTDDGLRIATSLDLGVAHEGFSVGDDGNLFVVIAGGVTEFAPARDGGFDKVPDGEGSPIAGVPVLHSFEISRSRTNYVRGRDDGPEFRNILASRLEQLGDELRTCPADIAFPFELVDADDHALILQRLAAGLPRADINFDGRTDFNDLLRHLTIFDECETFLPRDVGSR